MGVANKMNSPLRRQYSGVPVRARLFRLFGILEGLNILNILNIPNILDDVVWGSE